MTRWETLELLKFVCLCRHSRPISMSSYSNRNNQAASCFLRIVFVRRWHRWPHKVKRKMTQLEKMPSRWPSEGQNGHTNSKQKKHTFARSFGNSLAWQRFCHRPQSCCRSLRNSTSGRTMASDALTMFLRSEPNLNIFFIVSCPPGVNFGTVWNGHKQVLCPAMLYVLSCEKCICVWVVYSSRGCVV